MTTGRINQVAIARDEASRTRPTRRHKSRRPRGHRGPDGGAVLHTGGTSPSHANHNDQRTRTRRGTHSESLDLNRKRTVLVRCSPSPEWAPLRRGCHEIAKGGPPARLTGTPVLKETSDFPPPEHAPENATREKLLPSLVTTQHLPGPDRALRHAESGPRPLTDPQGATPTARVV